MKCRLCLIDGNLLKRSHIIPEFMYRELYDEEHKIYRLSPKKPHNFKRLSIGVYESNILCHDCDNKIIGRLESYARKVLYGGTLSKSQQPKFTTYRNQYGIEHTFIENIRYSDFKLFLLSILWRASISNRKYFEHVMLGSFEEELRLMIYNNDAREIEDFPCILMTVRNDVEWSKQLHVQPIRVKDESGSTYPFMISGTLYIYYVPNYFGHIELQDFCINNSNEMKILHTPIGHGDELLKMILGFKRNDSD